MADKTKIKSFPPDNADGYLNILQIIYLFVITEILNLLSRLGAYDIGEGRLILKRTIYLAIAFSAALLFFGSVTGACLLYIGKNVILLIIGLL